VFSVITVNFNNIDGLKRTAESVLSQRMSDFDWIVVDGGSSDGAVEFLSSIMDEKLAWTSEPDAGIFDGMNKGIARAKRQYCIFMNSGDTFADSGVLEAVVRKLDGRTYDLLYGDTYESDGKKLLLKAARKPGMNFYSMFTHHQSIFYRLERIVAGYDTKYRYSADWALTTRLLADKNTRLLRLDFPVSIFERGGISERTDQRRRINREHLQILRDDAKLGIVASWTLWFIKTRVNLIKTKAPRIYDQLRFRR
jgi:putative colanic acid biosynthesis glycosyltransferase